MIDIHNHILPGLDDGARGWKQSLAMARIAVADGIREVVCTPHWAPGVYKNTRGLILDAVDTLSEKLSREGIPLEVHPGAELRLDPDLPAKIESGEVLTLNDTGRFALIELPDICLLRNLEFFFRSMLDRGIIPIISHPERNRAIFKDAVYLFRWVEMGALVQVTAASVSGRFGTAIQRFSLFLLDHRMAHVVATDAHDLNLRSPVLFSAQKKVEEMMGSKTAWDMVNETPARILAGDRVMTDKPVPFEYGSSAVSLSHKIFSFLGIAGKGRGRR